MPKVSVIMPTYNHGSFLRKALDSVRAQTLVDWEVIVVNNFSTDDTKEIVVSYGDPRIRLISFRNFGVIGSSRNRGLMLARSPFVAFLDSDDFWYPRKLEICLKKIALGYDLVCHSEIWAGPGDRRRVVHYGPEKKATYEKLLLEGNCISTSAVVAKREWLERVEGFSEQREFVTAEDYALWLKLAKQGARIGFMRQVLGEYLIHEGGHSAAVKRNMQAVMAVVDSFGAEVNPSEFRLRRRKAIVWYSAARGFQHHGENKKAWEYLVRAISLYPWELRFYFGILRHWMGAVCFRNS